MPSTWINHWCAQTKNWQTYVQNAPADVMTIPGSDSTLEAQVERIISQQNPDRLVFAPIHQMAKELGISSQTLHRRLKESATSYQKIKDNLRREVAIQKLVNEKLSVEQVADIVGFYRIALIYASV